jgi:hypothetical protein
VLHKPSLKKNKRKLRGVRAGLVEPEVRPSLAGSHLSCSSVYWNVRCCATCWGKILNECALGELKRSPHQLFLYLFLFTKGTKGWTQKLYQFEHRGVQIFIDSRCMKGLWRFKFFLLLLLYLFLLFIYHGKLA